MEGANFNFTFNVKRNRKDEKYTVTVYKATTVMESNGKTPKQINKRNSKDWSKNKPSKKDIRGLIGSLDEGDLPREPKSNVYTSGNARLDIQDPHYSYVNIQLQASYYTYAQIRVEQAAMLCYADKFKGYRGKLLGYVREGLESSFDETCKYIVKAKITGPMMSELEKKGFSKMAYSDQQDKIKEVAGELFKLLDG